MAEGGGGVPPRSPLTPRAIPEWWEAGECAECTDWTDWAGEAPPLTMPPATLVLMLMGLDEVRPATPLGGRPSRVAGGVKRAPAPGPWVGESYERVLVMLCANGLPPVFRK